MRLFTGIDLPLEVKAKLEVLLDKLRPAAPLNWSRPANLHVTTKFIGEWPEERFSELVAALREIPSRAPIPITVRGLGWFPNPHSPRVLWAGIEAPGLPELASSTEQALARIGVAVDDRPFRPHLTLAKIKQTSKEPAKAAPVRRAIAALESTDFGAYTADRFYLYLSRRTPAGSIYTKLEEYRLTRVA